MTLDSRIFTMDLRSMVKRLMVFFAIGVVFTSTNVFNCYGQGLTVEFYQSEINSSNQVDVLLMKNYVRGALDGIQFTNAISISKNQAPSFCSPQSLGLGTSNAIQIIEDEIKTLPAEKDTNIIVLLLLGLQRAFPCTK